MPATVDYNTELKNQLRTSSENKRIALQNQFDRATGAQFNKDTGALTYRTDASGNPLYGTLDVDYMEQQRGINTQAEGAGMLRSGQRARNLATSEAGYRSTIGGLAESLAAGKTAISDDEALRIAEYDALYGSPKAGSSGGGGSTTPKTTTSGLPPVPPVPKPPTGPRTNTPPKKQGPMQGPSVHGPGNFIAPKTIKVAEHQAHKPTKPPLPKTTRRYVPYKPPLPPMRARK
jgi:hypothetical protein